MTSPEEAHRRWESAHGYADRLYVLSLYGDHIARERGWERRWGFEALRQVLARERGMLPSQASGLADRDLLHLFEEELEEFELPEGAPQPGAWR